MNNENKKEFKCQRKKPDNIFIRAESAHVNTGSKMSDRKTATITLSVTITVDLKELRGDYLSKKIGLRKLNNLIKNRL